MVVASGAVCSVLIIIGYIGNISSAGGIGACCEVTENSVSAAFRSKVDRETSKWCAGVMFG